MKFRPSKKDFSIDDLPSTRKAQLLDFFKTRFGMFFSFGGIFLLFGLPLLIAILLKYYLFLLPASQSLEEASYIPYYKTTCLIFNFVYCICFLFLFLAFAGLGRVFREWAWGKGVYFFHDFLTGIKKNFPSYLLLWFLFSLFYFVSKFISLSVSQIWVSYLAGGLCLLLLPVLLMAMSQVLYYSNNVGKLFANSFSYCFKKPLVTFAFLLFPYGVLCLGLIDQVMIMILVIALMFLLLLPFYFVGWHLFALTIFDEFTNKEYYPSIYHKGLRGEFVKEKEE